MKLPNAFYLTLSINVATHFFGVYSSKDKKNIIRLMRIAQVGS